VILDDRVYRLEGEVAALEARKPAPLGEKERRRLLQLGADLELAWSHSAATAATRKRILRAALYEIVVRIEGGFIEMVLHWQGGDHTALKLKMNGAGKHRWTPLRDSWGLRQRRIASTMSSSGSTRLRRSSTIRASSQVVIGVARRCGRVERSATSPRAFQRATVRGWMPSSRASAACEAALCWM
jgi:hypothetical protein